MRDGVRAQDVLAATAEALAEKGFKPTGFVGHSIGLTGHEPPDITDSQTMPIKKGMVLAIEVWIYEVKGFTRGGHALKRFLGKSAKILGSSEWKKWLLLLMMGTRCCQPSRVRSVPFHEGERIRKEG